MMCDLLLSLTQKSQDLFLCDYSDAYISVTGNIKVQNGNDATGVAIKKLIKKIVLYLRYFITTSRYSNIFRPSWSRQSKYIVILCFFYVIPSVMN